MMKNKSIQKMVHGNNQENLGPEGLQKLQKNHKKQEKFMDNIYEVLPWEDLVQENDPMTFKNGLKNYVIVITQFRIRFIEAQLCNQKNAV